MVRQCHMLIYGNIGINNWSKKYLIRSHNKDQTSSTLWGDKKQCQDPICLKGRRWTCQWLKVSYWSLNGNKSINGPRNMMEIRTKKPLASRSERREKAHTTKWLIFRILKEIYELWFLYKTKAFKCPIMLRTQTKDVNLQLCTKG